MLPVVPPSGDAGIGGSDEKLSLKLLVASPACWIASYKKQQNQ